ncbi:hypothetical protein GQ55_8G071000 [Panicum hallii var. hallii]|uniref:Uncharacterized protein n=2 Tax=Panicum hallii TaxID=206008 RepID=A0A2T7CLJ0_9POAL|nr:uncharacterized protein LOC112903315 [Panicum hallii]PAN41816.1 hypothetical protein PAHAL_8G071500 [Panicum hallii]PUZ44205.1 hypothetical protein GQ55_8G071000 [Panicum hallii var. hallii]
MAKNHHQVYLLFFLTAAAVAATVSAAAANLTAYEMLERYKFPRGILPQGVQRYVLRPDGSFEVFFSGSGCEFRVGGRYLLRYERRIAGTARAGSIRGLQGVSVKVLFVWLGINEVDRAGDQLNFHVGPLAASFPLRKFAVSPRCRCGFDCATAGDAAVAAS